MPLALTTKQVQINKNSYTHNLSSCEIKACV